MSKTPRSFENSLAIEALSPFGPEDYLFDDASLAHFLADALNDDEGNLLDALNIAARARGMADICVATGMPREELAEPTKDTIRFVFEVLGLQSTVFPLGKH